MNKDNELRHLEHQHRRLDREIGTLLRRGHLTAAEYQRAAALKKRKLQLKDGITALRRAHGR